jgi:hypothetical protein
MNTTELMIGDWVSVEDLIRCRVDKIFQDYVVCLDKRDNEIIGNIMPIPITVEILEKNGFEQTGDSTFSISDDGMRFNVTWWSKTMFNVGFYRRGNNSPSEQCCLNVCYVHELQHALRLCGMNELADNFKI